MIPSVLTLPGGDASGVVSAPDQIPPLSGRMIILLSTCRQSYIQQQQQKDTGSNGLFSLTAGLE